MDNIADMISKYGFPIVAAGGMAYLIHYIWKWVTEEAKPVLGEANSVLIALIDRIRMLDNDLIRLEQKLNTVLHLRGALKEDDIPIDGSQANGVENKPKAPAATEKKASKDG